MDTILLRTFLEQSGPIKADEKAIIKRLCLHFKCKPKQVKEFAQQYVKELKEADKVYQDDLCESAERNARNVHTFRFSYDSNFNRRVLLISDAHWDNPKCDRDLLKKHLEQAKAENALILFNGDTFCLMQGAYDPRKSKSDIRPEHNKSDYFDAIIRTAVEWFGPYAENIALVCRGNHETSILKRQETDMVQRFVDMMNMVHRPKQPIYDGGYGGWVRFMFQHRSSNHVQTHKLKYYHGTGGGGIVTKGIIQNQRLNASIEGADLIWNGHVHEDYITYYVKETLNKVGVVTQKECCHIRTSTYKEEYEDGFGGWHVERGAPPKPLGGAWLEFYYEAEKIKYNAWRAK
jgi:predicted phosphodiesterase